ncbi:MAG: methionyl-tRNA formyltransferase [Roseibacillus sp.]|nr:methionyl-tRNA formyltransferase [Roseibacillus sp.]
MRIVFMGTGEIALPSFRMMVEAGGLVGLVTQPDRPVGRSSRLRPPRIKELAGEAGLPVLQPARVRGKEAIAEIEALDPDLIVVMAYGQILPGGLLELPAHGCINVHASLLPRHRGASCIQAAVAAGDKESGVSIIVMDDGLDTGEVINRRAIPLHPAETGGTLHDRLAELAPKALAESLRRIATGEMRREPQDDSLATYAPKLERAEGEVNWGLPADELERRIRAHEPWPGSFTAYRDNRGRARRLKLFAGGVVMQGESPGKPGELCQVGSSGILVACGRGGLWLGDVQGEGGKRLSVREFLRGHQLAAGEYLFSLAGGS